MNNPDCFHCGTKCGSDPIVLEGKPFCCNGCKTVFEILNQNELNVYYDLESSPGMIPNEIAGKFDYLANQDIAKKLLEFDDEETSVVNFFIPSIHCSSCIWVLENLNKLNSGVQTTLVNFPKKEVRITFKKNEVSLQQLAELITSIGYEPYISLESADADETKVDRKLIYQVAVAGFAFGNIMMLSFPEYFQVDEFWLNRFKPFFRGIMLAMAIPAVVYSGRDYLISAFKGLKHGILNIDVPISLGILVLFFRSSYEVVTGTGQGYFDSLTGLIFFLLLGKVFQQKTYSFLSFERDYKSYFPIAVTQIDKDKTQHSISINDVKQGDRLLIRNEEIIPVDGILLNGDALIDYSFVTGESLPLSKMSGDKLYAGGKQKGPAIEMEAIESVKQSYLTQLWSKDIFGQQNKDNIKTLTDSISKQFTLIILGIALAAGIYWYFQDRSIAFQVVSAILIVACPCALALSAPFSLGNMIRIFGKDSFYLKDAYVRFETFEFSARTIIGASTVGDPCFLSNDQIEEFETSIPDDIPEMDKVEYSADERSIRTNISELVRRACDQGLMISSYGTVSVRWYDNNFLITPRNVPRWEILNKDIVQIRDGKREPGKLPSRAVRLHEQIYKENPDVNSIILTQSPNVMAFGVSQALLDVRTIPESWIFLQDIPVIPFGKQFSSDGTISKTISKNTPALIIQNDSIVVTGDQLLQTFDRLEVAEFSAKSLIMGKSIGELVPINNEQIEDLRKKFLN